jgi:formate-dependent nitrite reductase membrane component NrfD
VTRRDGRFIDPRLGILEGEGAQQESVDQPDAGPVWDQLPSSTHRPNDETYYEQPAIKEPVWIWAVPAYFFAGGAAGAAAALGASAQVIDNPGLRHLIVGCRRIAAAGSAAGTVLLIIDLGRPARFLNMLRVFRPTSPLNLGSWLLAAITPLAGGAWTFARSRGRTGRLGDAAGLMAGILGLPLSGYTAVLLTNTAVPLWANIRVTLPGLFVSSAVSSATSLLGLAELNGDERTIVDRIDVVATAAELAAAFAVERDAKRVEEVARPLREGLSGKLWSVSTGCTVGGLMLAVLPGKSKTKTIASSVLGTIGSASMRFAIFHGGKASARSPRATFRSQRAGLGAAEITGRSAVTGPTQRATDPSSQLPVPTEGAKKGHGERR